MKEVGSNNAQRSAISYFTWMGSNDISSLCEALVLFHGVGFTHSLSGINIVQSSTG